MVWGRQNKASAGSGGGAIIRFPEPNAAEPVSQPGSGYANNRLAAVTTCRFHFNSQTCKPWSDVLAVGKPMYPYPNTQYFLKGHNDSKDYLMDVFSHKCNHREGFYFIRDHFQRHCVYVVTIKPIKMILRSKSPLKRLSVCFLLVLVLSVLLLSPRSACLFRRHNAPSVRYGHGQRAGLCHPDLAYIYGGVLVVRTPMFQQRWMTTTAGKALPAPARAWVWKPKY
jgi:hypothetical protein